MFREYDMYPVVRRVLRQRYKVRDGWKIEYQPQGRTYRPDFLVHRKRRGINEKVVVEVKRECRVTVNHIKQLNEYARKIAGPQTRVVEKILVIPSGAVINEEVRRLIKESGIEIIRLKIFRCE